MTKKRTKNGSRRRVRAGRGIFNTESGQLPNVFGARSVEANGRRRFEQGRRYFLQPLAALSGDEKRTVTRMALEINRPYAASTSPVKHVSRMANCKLSFVQPVDFHRLIRINSEWASTSVACLATSGAAIDPLRRPSSFDPKVQFQSGGADRFTRTPRCER